MSFIVLTSQLFSYRWLIEYLSCTFFFPSIFPKPRSKRSSYLCYFLHRSRIRGKRQPTQASQQLGKQLDQPTKMALAVLEALNSAHKQWYRITAIVIAVAIVGSLAIPLVSGWLSDKLGCKMLYGLTLILMVICAFFRRHVFRCKLKK